MFDVKFLRDELLFYSRDENQFLRQRRAFVFALYPDLAEARVKDAGLPWQRVILLLAMLYAAVHRLIDWLSDDSLTFHFAFLQTVGKQRLRDEQTLLETLFREQIDNGTVRIGETTSNELIERCREYSGRSQTHGIFIGTANRSVSIDNTLLTRLRLRSAVVEHACDDKPFATSDQSGIAGWQQTLAALLEEWVC